MSAQDDGAARFRTMGVIGAGIMGAGIAQIAADAGLEVILTDARDGAAAKAKSDIAARLGKRVAEGKMPADALERLLARLRPGTIAEMGAADIVVEAIVEDLAAKRQVFAALEDIVRADAILATNTSALSITAIAAGCRHKERIAGLHFFNPVPVMKLVEVVRGLTTAPGVVADLTALSRRLGKQAVVVADTPGFLVNHAGRAYVTEALHVLTEGVADIATIDAIMRDCCGFRLGPFELMDLTGIDVNHPVTETVHQGFAFDPRLKTVPLHRSLREAGLLGRKTGHGFYRYGVNGETLGPHAPVPPQAAAPARLIVPEGNAAAALFPGIETTARDDGQSPIVVAFTGSDGSTTCRDMGLDPRRFVGVDALFASPRRLTLMRLPGSDPIVAARVAACAAEGQAVSIIADSPGFVAQRLVLMILNLAADIAQQGIAAPADIDMAVQLGLAYPKGPLRWADDLGLDAVVAATDALHAVQRTDRYRPSPWLRRRAQLGLSALTV